MKKKDHYRITIDVVAEHESVDRCADIEHHLYMVEKELLPYTVRKEKIEYKVEKLCQSVTWKKYDDAMALADKWEEGYEAGVYDTKRTLLKLKDIDFIIRTCLSMENEIRSKHLDDQTICEIILKRFKDFRT